MLNMEQFKSLVKMYYTSSVKAGILLDFVEEYSQNNAHSKLLRKLRKPFDTNKTALKELLMGELIFSIFIHYGCKTDRIKLFKLYRKHNRFTTVLPVPIKRRRKLMAVEHMFKYC